MGLFDFLKPKKDPLTEFLQLRDRVAALQGAGQEDAARLALGKFLADYTKNGRGEVASRLDLARLSYAFVYHSLPDLVHKRWDEFCSVWASTMPFPTHIALAGATGIGKRLTLEQIAEFKYHRGELPSRLPYFLLEFPVPPDQSEGPDMNAMMAALAQGKKPTINELPVLGPYFAVAVWDIPHEQRHLYVLGQSPMGGTTLRFVSADGVNANCGPGPDNPVASEFLDAVHESLAS